ncbi:Hypothetical protein FKW44_003953 [Caligus rogercresseyi]|uniref:Uncharacterized protein n=1 Tax=Caligus rogercresseyi TaxID=217165 RepID=A0A7T8KMD0_CALRO|nr:Hypothetical protein FKW44_003953 [Caligus rogercresseyi]
MELGEEGTVVVVTVDACYARGVACRGRWVKILPSSVRTRLRARSIIRPK